MPANASAAGKKNLYALHIAITACIYLTFALLLPTPPPLTRIGAQVLGIFFATVYAWTMIDLTWTTILGLALLTLSGVTSPAVIYQQSWGNGIVPFLFLCLVFNKAMEECGLSRRIALFFVTRKMCRGRPWLILVMFFIPLWLVCGFCAVTPIVTLYLTIAEEIFAMTGIKKGDRAAETIVILINCVGLVAQCISPMSHVVTAMGVSYVLEFFGINVSVVRFMMFGLPVGAASFVVFLLIARVLFRPDVSKLADLDIEKLKATVPPMGRRERATLISFILLVLMWLSPDFLKLLPVTAPLGELLAKMGTYWPPFLIFGIMGAIRMDGKPLIDFPRLSKSINWTSIIMLTGLMCLSYCFNAESAGITAWLRGSIGALLTDVRPGVFVAIAMGCVMLLTNFMPNSVTASLFTVFVPIGMGIAGVNPIAMGLLLCAAANFGFAFPAANPSSGIVAGCGWVRMSGLMTKGTLLTVVGWLIVVLVGYPLACMAFPY